jgi:hypothetical protein
MSVREARAASAVRQEDTRRRRLGCTGQFAMQKRRRTSIMMSRSSCA